MVALYFHYLLVHILKQRIIKKLDLVQVYLPFTNKGEIAGIFLLYKNLFNVDEYVSEVVLRSLSLLIILSVQSFLAFIICSVQYAAFASNFFCVPFFEDSYDFYKNSYVLYPLKFITYVRLQTFHIFSSFCTWSSINKYLFKKLLCLLI